MTRLTSLRDGQGRVLQDLRISITDRCNFRCLYCLPETEAGLEYQQTRFRPLGAAPAPSALPPHASWQPRKELLTLEEIVKISRVAVSLGITKLRVTGGEPLLRRNVEALVGSLASLEGVEDLALTTNGFLFAQKAQALKQAGLKRVTFSLDSLDAATFKKIAGRDGLKEVIASIEAAKALQLSPIKVNMVVIRGMNDHELEAMTTWSRDTGVILRFIEFMPLDSGHQWSKDQVMPGREILERLRGKFDLIPVLSGPASETAKRWTFSDGRGEIGVIAPVSEPFCGHCNRLRLTADGKIRTCLFSIQEHDIKKLVRAGASDEELAEYFHAVVLQKEPGHRIGQPDFVPASRSMSCIGG